MPVVLNVLYWVFFAATFLLVLNQLMYQEHSIIFSWYKQAAGFHVFWLMMTFWAGIGSVALFVMHMPRHGFSLMLLAMAWVFFFLMYNAVIESDVKNKITAGDLPPSDPDASLVDQIVEKMENNNLNSIRRDSALRL